MSQKGKYKIRKSIVIRSKVVDKYNQVHNQKIFLFSSFFFEPFEILTIHVNLTKY